MQPVTARQLEAPGRRWRRASRRRRRPARRRSERQHRGADRLVHRTDIVLLVVEGDDNREVSTVIGGDELSSSGAARALFERLPDSAAESAHRCRSSRRRLSSGRDNAPFICRLSATMRTGKCLGFIGRKPRHVEGLVKKCEVRPGSDLGWVGVAVRQRAAWMFVEEKQDYAGEAPAREAPWRSSLSRPP